jgi:hypothetical protein
MTRTVEQLQLSVEDEDCKVSPGKTLIKRMNFLPRCKSWSETEERRRVFWNIFSMDRFCSIVTGWNFSLTSADVKRRLPCEGGLWELGQAPEVATPYFGIADQSSCANPSVPSARPDGQDQDLLGGFAFCIEATESLSLVTSFFLQHDLDFSDIRQLQVWLMRFKQLDLRLIQSVRPHRTLFLGRNTDPSGVRWKIFLPEPWREACVLNADGNMDPNLTLAHMTHNTAAILLHQVIAFPLPEWQESHMRLPSASSAETCLAAASEVAIIAEEFLRRSTILTNPQFAFCLFICGRLLLAYSSYRNEPLLVPFDSLVESLLETSRRWKGLDVMPESETVNLASKFATRLIDARREGQGALDLRDPVYSDDQYVEKNPIGLQATGTVFPQSEISSMSRLGPAEGINHGGTPSPGDHQEASPDSISMAFPPLPLSFRGPISFTNPSANGPNLTMTPGGTISGVGLHATIPDGGTNGYEAIEAFLDSSFAPDQRVSVFSYTSNNILP